MKRFLLLIAALAGFSVAAQTFKSGTLAAATNNIVSAQSVALTYLSLVDTSGTNNLMIVYDNNVATSTNIITPAVTGAILTYSTNIVSTYTDPEGQTRNTTNSVIFRTTQTIAGATNEARRIFVALVPANGSITFPIQSAVGTVNGLVIKSANAGIYNAELRNLP